MIWINEIPKKYHGVFFSWKLLVYFFGNERLVLPVIQSPEVDWDLPWYSNSWVFLVKNQKPPPSFTNFFLKKFHSGDLNRLIQRRHPIVRARKLIRLKVASSRREKHSHALTRRGTSLWNEATTFNRKRRLIHSPFGTVDFSQCFSKFWRLERLENSK